MSAGDGTDGEHPWAMLGRRIKHPCRQWTFYVVLILGIVVLGYLAVWIEVAHVWNFQPTAGHKEPDLQALRLAYATAVLAVGAPCVMQLGLTMNKMAIVSSFVLIFIVLWLAYWVTNADTGTAGVHFYGLISFLVAILCWWLANGEDELFQDRAPPGAASGGDPQRSLKGGNSEVKV